MLIQLDASGALYYVNENVSMGKHYKVVNRFSIPTRMYKCKESKGNALNYYYYEKKSSGRRREFICRYVCSILKYFDVLSANITQLLLL